MLYWLLGERLKASKERNIAAGCQVVLSVSQQKLNTSVDVLDIDPDVCLPMVSCKNRKRLLPDNELVIVAD